MFVYEGFREEYTGGVHEGNGPAQLLHLFVSQVKIGLK